MKTLAVKESTYNELLKMKEKEKVKNFDELLAKIIKENKRLKRIILAKKIEESLTEDEVKEIKEGIKEFRKNFLKRCE